MPTYDMKPRFLDDLKRLTPEEYRQFKRAVQKFVDDLKAGRPPRKSLGIERFESRKGVYELHWSGDGRALFRFGASPHEGEVHIVWLRVGTHDIYDQEPE